MTTTAVKTITALIIAFALASAVMASPASALSTFPADLQKAASSQAGNAAANQCQHSRFGCSIGGR